MSEDLGRAAVPAPRPAPPVSDVRTFLVADVRGYTAFTQRFGDERAAALAARFAVVTREVLGADGVVLELRGDEALCVFASPRRALRSAVSLQRRFAEESAADPDLPLAVGIGIDVGEAVAVENGYRGGALNLAARLCALAGPGRILATAEVTHLAQRLDGVTYVPGEPVRLAGLTDPVRAVRVVPDEDPAERLALLRAPPPAQRSAGARRRALRRHPRVVAGALLVVAAVVAASVVALRGGHPRLSAFAEDVAGVVDPVSGALVEQVPVGMNPTALAAGADAVWAVDTDDDTVDRIDPASHRVVQTVDVGGAPSSVVVGGGSVWVANSSAGTVSRIEPGTGRVRQTLPAGAAPSAVAWARGALWVADTPAAAVLRVDPVTGTVTARVAVGDAPSGLVAGGGQLWVSSSGDGTVSPIDPATATAGQPLHVGNDPRGMALDHDDLWVANDLDGTVTRVDTATGAVRAVIPVGGGPVGVAVAGGRVWVADQDGAALTRVDPARGTAVATVPTGSAPAAVVAVGDRLWVAAGARPAQHRGGTVAALLADVALDPDAVDAPSAPVQRMLYDGLVGLRQASGAAGDVVVPDLAESLPTPTDGGLTWVFRLRRGVRWSTGAPVTGRDVRRGLERTAAAGLLLDVAVRGADRCTTTTCDLSGGVAVDDAARTVTIRLDRPAPEFLLQLAEVVAVPVSTPVAPVDGPLPTTGPYRVARYGRTGPVVLERNPLFREWSHAAQPAGIPDRFVLTPDPSWGEHPDQDAARPGFDWMDVRGADLTALRGRVGDRLRVSPRLVVRYAFLNATVAPFDSADARRAVAFAVDRAAVAADWPGPAVVTCQVLPPTVPGYRPYCPTTLRADASGSWYAPDLATAQDLVRRSGTAGAAVTVRTTTFAQPAMQHVVDAMNQIGYRASLAVEPVAPYFDDLAHNPEWQAGFIGFIAAYPSPSQFASTGTCELARNGTDPAHYCDPALDALVATAEGLGGRSSQASADAWAAVDRALTDAAPLVPLVYDSNAALVSARVRHYEVAPSGPLLDQVWLR